MHAHRRHTLTIYSQFTKHIDWASTAHVTARASGCTLVASAPAADARATLALAHFRPRLPQRLPGGRFFRRGDEMLRGSCAPPGLAGEPPTPAGQLRTNQTNERPRNTRKRRHCNTADAAATTTRVNNNYSNVQPRPQSQGINARSPGRPAAASPVVSIGRHTRHADVHVYRSV